MGVRALLSVLAVAVGVGPCWGQSLPIGEALRYEHLVQGSQVSSPTHLEKGRLLVASRRLGDPNFAETVVLLLSADATGTMGIIINRQTKVKLASVLPTVKELRDRPDRLFVGGPVSGNVLVLLMRARSQPTKSERIVGDVYATGNPSALHEALAHKGKVDRLHAYAGYAGWGPGQLELEVSRGDWLVGPADASIIFDVPPADMWPKLVERLSGAWTKNDRVPGLRFPVSGS